MSEGADFKGSLDHIKLQKFKKTQGYDSKLDKLFQKAKKAKPNKENIQVKSAVGAMKFKSFGKKPSPVNSIDYEKIKKIIESTPSERVVAFAYPGPDEKSPIMLHAMRFKGEKDYTYFVERMSGRVRSSSRPNSRSPPMSDRQSMTEPLNDNNRVNTPSEHTKQHTNRTPSRGTAPSARYSTPPSRTSSTSSSSEYGRKLPSSHSQGAARGAESFISTDSLLPPGRMRGRRRSPMLKIKSPYETSYICARWRIRESPSSRRRPASAQPRRQHSPKSTRRPVKVGTLYKMPGSSSSESSYSASDASYSDCCGESSSSTDYTPVRSKSHNRIYYGSDSESCSSSGDSTSTDSLQLFGKSLPNSRSYVISRCTGDHRSALKCRPVGGFTVTSETPSFMYEA